MPLSKEQLTGVQSGIKKADDAIKIARIDIATAKRAGIDVTDQEARLKEMSDQIRKMRAVYGT